jgi:hypothetical protein
MEMLTGLVPGSANDGLKIRGSAVAGRDRDSSEAEIKIGSEKVAPIRADRLLLQAPETGVAFRTNDARPDFSRSAWLEEKMVNFQLLVRPRHAAAAPTRIPLSDKPNAGECGIRVTAFCGFCCMVCPSRC